MEVKALINIDRNIGCVTPTPSLTPTSKITPKPTNTPTTSPTPNRGTNSNIETILYGVIIAIAVVLFVEAIFIIQRKKKMQVIKAKKPRQILKTLFFTYQLFCYFLQNTFFSLIFRRVEEDISATSQKQLADFFWDVRGRRMQKLALRLIMISLIVLVLTGVFLSKNLVASAKTQGYISITFDDGFQNQYDNAYPLLHSRGMNATYFIITNRTNTPNYMTVAVLQTLQNSGSEIGSHSVTHPDCSSISDSQLQNECQLSKQTLQSWGLSVNDFAYPYGSRNSRSDSIVAKYYQSARSAYTAPFIIQVPTSQFLLPGFPGETGDSTALSKAESMVDQVYASNAWAIIFFHNVLPNPTGNFSISTKDFASFLDYISSKGVRTLTVNQALNLGSQTYTPPSAVINPSSVSMYVGQSQTFSTSVSGGSPPYSYKWYLNNSIVPSSAVASYAFVPPQAGTASIYVNVTDGTNTVTKSNTVNVQVYKQYSLLLSTNSGTISPSNSSYNENSTVSITATPPVATAEERYIWLGWLGQGTGNYTGMNNPAQIAMNGAINETAQWQHQYLVTLNSSGLASDATGTSLTVEESNNSFSDLPTSIWVDSGNSLNFTYEPTIYSTTNLKQFVLTNITASSPLVITAPTTVMATYKTQYYLTVNSPYGTITGSGWYDGGTNAIVTLDSSTIPSSPGTQYAFAGWSPDSNNITIASNDTATTAIINGPGTITANFETKTTPVSTTDTTTPAPTPSPTRNPTTPSPTKTPTPSNSPPALTSSITKSTPVPTATQTPSPSPNHQSKGNISSFIYGLVAVVSMTVILFPITVINIRRRLRFR